MLIFQELDEQLAEQRCKQLIYPGRNINYRISQLKQGNDKKSDAVAGFDILLSKRC